MANYYIPSGIVSNGIWLGAKDCMFVSNGGTANRTIVNSGGSLYISYGGAVNSTTVNGFMMVSNGGMATSTTVEFGGSLHIRGSAIKTFIDSSSIINVDSDGRTDDTTVAGSMRISNGGIATSTKIIIGGLLTILSGGMVNNTTIYNGCFLTVSSGGIANNTQINIDGNLHISSGGMAHNVIVNSGGALYVSRGGSASIAFNPWGGSVMADAEAQIDYRERDAGVYWGNNLSGMIGKSDVVNNIIISSGISLLVYNDGVAINASVGSDSFMAVREGGTASETSVNSGGSLYVSSGGTANNTIVNRGGYMTVADGGTATILFDPWQKGIVVETGATVSYYRDADVFWGNEVNGLIGKTHIAKGVTISSGISMHISSGGTAVNTVVESDAFLYVFDNGTAKETMINAEGNLIVSNAGMTMEMMVNSGGSLYVSSGGTANNTIVNRGGYMTIADGGTATILFDPWQKGIVVETGATVSYYRDADVFWGNDSRGIVGKNDSAKAVTISNGIIMYVYSDGVATDTKINSGGFLHISSGGMASRTIVNAEGNLIVSSAGMAMDTIINSGGFMCNAEIDWPYVSGGSMTHTVINSGGVLLISRGGVADNTTVSGGGQFVVSFGTATSTTVFSGGIVNGFTVQEQNFYAGGLHISNAEVTSGREAELEGEEQTASKIYVHAGGNVLLDGGSEISEVTVGERGYLDVFDGTAEQILVQSGGGGEVGYYGVVRTVIIENGASFLVSGYSPVNSAQTASCFYGTVLSGGIMSVADGGAANSSTISSGGCIRISSGGKATETIVQPGGLMVVSDSGRASIAFNPWQGNVISSAGARVTYLERDAGVYWGNQVSGMIGKTDIAEDINISSGVSMLVYSGGTANRTNVDSGGSMTVFRHGVIKHTTINTDGFLYISSAGSADSTTVSGHGIITIGNGGYANNTLLENTAYMDVSSGGTATHTIAAYAKIFAFQGASVSGTELNSWGVLSAMGEVHQTTVNSGGLMHVFKGGTASGTIINAYGSLYVSSGGSAVDILLKSNGSIDIRDANIHSLTVSRGGSCAIVGGTVNKLALMSRGTAVVSNTEINDVEVFSSGRLECISDLEGRMTIAGAIVHSDGQITMSSGTLISAASINKAGTLNLENGGSAYQTRINEEGKFTMLGVANHTILNGGSMYVGDSAYRDYDGTGGMPTSNVYDEDIHASVNVLNSSWMHVYSGGTATSNTISSNSWAHVYWGGTATSNVINSSGYLTLQDSGTADTTVLHSGGYMRLYAGAILKGETSVGGKVTVENAGTSATEDVIRAYGARINYLVSERTTFDESIITDLGMIMGATYFITVSADQQSGTYRLADGAEDFTGSITVKNTANQELGILSVGQTLQANGVSYSLNLTDNLLTLTVSGGLPGKMSVRSDIDGNGVSDILFQNLVDSANPLGTWLNADPLQWNGALGPAAKSEWIVYGAFDFTGDGKGDIMFRNIGAAEGAVGYYDSGEDMAFKTIGWGVNLDWDLAMVGDVNGDGKADILWQNNQTHGIGLWLDGTDRWASVWGNVDSSWELCGMGDVNGDGRDDIIINANGRLGAWDIQSLLTSPNTGITPEWVDFGIAIGKDWQVREIADFDNNGKADLLLWNDNGYVGAYMNCDPNDFRTVFANASHSEWDLPGVGDYNGDGYEDILVRNNETGALGYWDGAADFEWKPIGFGVDNTWAVIA